MKQVVENIPKRKINAVTELTNLIKSKRTILIADVSAIPGSQYQIIVKKLRGKAVVKVPKRNLLLRALNAAGKKEAEALAESVKGAVSIIFSDLDSYELAAELLKIKSSSKAKPGQIAPRDITIPGGPTDLVPGPAISELGALGIKIMIKAGKVEIKEDKIVAQEGKPISAGAAAMLSKLNILPFTIGFTPLSAYDSNDKIIYTGIKIDAEEAINELVEAYSKSLAFAVGIGHYGLETTPLMVQKAAAYERKLIRVITGEPEEVAPVAEAVPAQEEIKEEKKEEPVSFGGFF
ncbi:MAG: 50S ribosomal protein L10 [Nanoarchaeota archaeon]|jgi:large subunit ribosomal protein L10|nr:50S ribosomal protein L10 [Nanoarchaeota archaeon]